MATEPTPFLLEGVSGIVKNSRENNSKLLIDEHPLLIMPQLACTIGLNESIVLQQIHYWCQMNAKTGKNYKKKYYWTYNTYEEWQKQFPFWSVMTIKRIIAKLEDKNLLISDCLNKLKIDRTKWYRINYDTLQNIDNTHSINLIRS